MITLLTLSDYLMGREKKFPITDSMHIDALVTVSRANQLLTHFGESRKINSGYRPSVINAHISGAAKNSNHTLCRAIDLSDPDGRLDQYCLNNLSLLADIGLWMESPKSTPAWCHVQIVPPHSGNRVFLP